MDFLDTVTAIGSDTMLKSAYSEFAEGSYKASFDSFSGLDSAEAVYCVAFHYLHGKGVKKDEKKAFSLFEESMKKGYVPAICEVAQCYGYGIGVKMNDAKAFELFNEAASVGDPYGMAMLSMMYANGDGVNRNKKESEKWNRMCEEAGDIEDIESVGLDYLVSGNALLGRIYLMRSAVMGSPVSAKALEFMYSFGKGVRVDEDEASDWADTADSNGWDEVTRSDLEYYEGWFSEFMDIGELPDDEE